MPAKIDVLQKDCQFDLWLNLKFLKQGWRVGVHTDTFRISQVYIPSSNLILAYDSSSAVAMQNNQKLATNLSYSQESLLNLCKFIR